MFPRPPRRQIEREFGVPVPGEIVDPARWTSTALKTWPEGPLDWMAIFGREAPRVLDLGCGNARYLLGSALWRPDHDHLGVDVLPLVIRYATRRANQRGLSNIRLGVRGGRELLERHIPDASVAEIHCYHPQPYHDPAEAARRLVTPEFLALAHNRLVPGGLLYLQTDHPAYWSYMRQIAAAFFDFREQLGCWPDAPKGRTRREIIALRQGLPVFRGVGTAKAGVSPGEALRQARSLPPPLFDVSRQMRDLDRLEQQLE